MDFARHQNLHTIIMLRDVIRKWWRCELTFANREGQVVDWERGEFVAPPNDFCRLSLYSPSGEGMRRCMQSARMLHEQFRGPRKLRHAVSHECHLGFQIVGAPLYVHGEYEGVLFVEGFAPAPPSPAQAARLKEKVLELNPVATDLERAVERIPVFAPGELEKLTDLLEVCVDEIASFEHELSRKKEEQTAPLARSFSQTSGNLNEAVEQLEREMIAQGLLRTGNNKSQLARELGISRSNLILKIAKYALEEPTPPPEASA